MTTMDRLETKPTSSALCEAVLLPLAFSIWAATALAQHAASNAKVLESTGPSPVELDFPSAGSVSMEICPSGLLIKGTDKNHLRITFVPDESSTARDLRVRLRVAAPTPSRNTAEIKIGDCPHNNFKVTVEVPTTVDLRVRMPAGQLELKGVTGNKDLELHAGQLDVEINKAAEYAHVDGSVTTGQVDAEPWDVSKGGLFRSFSREGPGKYRLHAHVGAGQITLRNAEN
jgi:hypothetical protein